ncbi:LutC/YkgG family protein [Actinocorallia populi]|uniref:LutC/YkgG family protein n=1 Tax=Actinocorallia populi TaxID=2079200 RepID=UPI000D08B909|nr:LUD domain-containing protein [Actinocorallia populi]
MNAREEILHRVREALGADRGGGFPAPSGRVRRTDGRASGQGELAALFAERAAEHAGGGTAVRHVGADGLGTAVAAALWARGAGRIAVPADLPFGWLAALRGVEALADAPPLEPDELAGVDGTVTGCALAVAETGTVVLDGGGTQGRRALTLVPGYHLCVVRAEQIVATVPEAVGRLAPGRPLTWISGRPADGAGARVLELLIVEE